MYFVSDFSALSKFIKCLESLPSLHTLEIGQDDECITTPLGRNALKLKRVNLPQIKTLILPPAAHLLLKYCPNVEDVNWVIGNMPIPSGGFLGSLASIRDSKVKRLTISLVLPGNPSSK